MFIAQLIYTNYLKEYIVTKNESYNKSVKVYRYLIILKQDCINVFYLFTSKTT